MWYSNLIYVLTNALFNQFTEVSKCSKLQLRVQTTIKVDKPTRIRNGKCSIVDHILTNDMQNSLTPGILLADVSDHLPTFLVLKNLGPEAPSYPRMVRDYSNFKQSHFLSDLASSLEPIKRIREGLSGNTIFGNFLNILNQVVDRHAPLRECTKKITGAARIRG